MFRQNFFSQDVHMLRTFLVIRLSSVLIIQTWFVPDEYYQSLEPAHRKVFGYGYLTWEFKEKIRGGLYPSFISAIFTFLKYLNIDYPYLVIHIPRYFSAILFACGDFFIYKFSKHHFGSQSAKWTAVCISSNWFLYYCAPRTLSNCMEMVLTSFAVYLYPWHVLQEQHKVFCSYIYVSGLAVAVRPTAMIIVMPLFLRHLCNSSRRFLLLINFLIGLFIMSLFTYTVDILFDPTSKLQFIPWEFFKFNVVSGLAAHYGLHPWHWYLSQGLPVTCGLHLLPALFGVYTNFWRYGFLVFHITWCVTLLSFIGHKEFRFLLPTIPFIMCIAGDVLRRKLQDSNGRHAEHTFGGIRLPCSAMWMFGTLLVLIVPNVFAVTYLGMIHQRGPLDIMDQLDKMVGYDTKHKSVLVLAPCHSTPFYSHLHRNIPLRFLTCEPNIKRIPGYLDEADIFYLNPQKWMMTEYAFKEPIVKNLQVVPKGRLKLPNFILLFDHLAQELKDLLSSNGYHLCKKLFHAHFHEGRRGKYFDIYCK